MAQRKVNAPADTTRPPRARLVARAAARLSGTPVFAGTRVPVKTLFDYLSEGEPLSVFLDHFPDVERAQVIALLEQVGEELNAGA